MQHPQFNILLIEDDPNYLDLIPLLLARSTAAHFKVEYTTRLAEALKRLADGGIDIILLDLDLPDSLGMPTLTRILAGAPAIPVVVLTGMDDTVVGVQALQAGAQDYLDKGRIESSLLARIVYYAIERHRTQEALRLSEQRFRMLIEKNSDGMLIVNREGVIRFANPAAEVFFDRTFQELQGMAFGFPIATGNVVELEINRPGRTLVAEMRVADVEWNGEAAWLASLRDITPLKQIEERLRHHHDQLRKRTATLREANRWLTILRRVDAELFRRLNMHYVVKIGLDAALRIALADGAYVALAEEGGLRIIDSLGPLPRGILNQMLPQESSISARVLRTQQAELIRDVSQDPDYYDLVPGTRAQMTMPLIAHRKSIGVLTLGTTHPARFRSEVFEVTKLLTARLATAIDNALMYEESRRLIHELDAYAHTVAHDLKNPLNIIEGYGALLHEEYARLSDDELAEYTGLILKTGRKMTNIVNELLLLAEVRKMGTIKAKPLDMATIVREATARLTTQISASEATIALPETWPVAEGYAPWVEEVWSNYISNAIKYGGKPPRVELGATLEDAHMIRFWTRDNGPGIPPDKLPHLFRQFTRLDETRAQGHGLGLSIVQRVVSRLGGETRAESTEGQGSTFSFTLPVAKDAPTG